MNILRKSKQAVLLAVFCITQILWTSGSSFSEIIYTQQGDIIKAKIIEVDDATLWYKKQTGDIIEEIGLDISDIDRVLNDDGTVSEYSPVNVKTE